jgi:hypothetical protein
VDSFSGVTQMVKHTRKNSGKRPADQAAEAYSPEPNEIGADTPYELARKERHPDGLNVSVRCHDLQDDRVRFVRPSLPAIFRFEKITRVPTERRIAFV